MMRQIGFAVAIVVFGGGTVVARAAEPQPVEPSLVVQIKSIEGLLNDFKYFMQMANRTDAAAQVDGVIEAWAGPKGLAGSGIDVKRPFLVYAVAKAVGPDNPFAVMVPIDNSETLLKLLESLAIPVTKGDDGSYSMEVPGRPAALFFRFANDYMYLTAVNKENIEPSALMSPSKLISNNANTILGVTLRIDQISESMKQLILGQMELRLADVKERKPAGESAQQARLRRQGIDTMAMVTKTILNEGRNLQLLWTLDRAKDDINLSIALDGKPNTAMATVISALSGGPSKFAPAKDAAFHVGLNFAVPQFIRPLIGGFIDMGAKDVVARESDVAKREANMKLIDAILPTLKNGVLDLHLVAGTKGGSGKYNICAALGVENGKAIESAVKELVKTIPAEEQNRIKLDVSKEGDVNLHQIRVDNFDAQAQRLFGDKPNLWAGFSGAALMLGIGGDSAEVFQAVTSGKDKVASPLLVIEGSLRSLAAVNPDPGAVETATEVFSKAPTGADRFRLSLEGGKQLKLALSFRGQAIKFATELNEKRKQ